MTVYVPLGHVPDEPVEQPCERFVGGATGSTRRFITTPLLNWTYAGGLTIGGWALQLDTTAQFNARCATTSFNDQGFDATNLTYEPQQSLNDGTTRYWRERATQRPIALGNWSETNHFPLPDTTTWDLGNNKVAANSAMSRPCRLSASLALKTPP